MKKYEKIFLPILSCFLTASLLSLIGNNAVYASVAAPFGASDDNPDLSSISGPDDFFHSGKYSGLDNNRQCFFDGALRNPGGPPVFSRSARVFISESPAIFRNEIYPINWRAPPVI